MTFGAAALLWLVVVGAPPSLVLSDTSLAHYRCLRDTKAFSGAAVGIAGEEPAESKAIRALTADRRGGTAFRYLLFTGSRAGKLYGLVGLRHTNRRLFTIAVQPFRVWPGEVETQFGCIGQSVPVRDVVENPAAVRLNDGESVGDAFRRPKRATLMELDIIGGGYTSMFVDYAEFISPEPAAVSAKLID